MSHEPLSRVWALGLRAGLGSFPGGLGFRAWGRGLKRLGLRVKAAGFGLQGLGTRVLGFRV